MPVKVTEQDKVYIIAPEGPSMALDSHAELRDLFKQLKEKAPKGVVLDLMDVSRIDSLGLGSLISGRLTLRGTCEISLCRLSPIVESLVRHSRMDLLFPIYDSLQKAVEAAKSGAVATAGKNGKMD